MRPPHDARRQIRVLRDGVTNAGATRSAAALRAHVLLGVARRHDDRARPSGAVDRRGAQHPANGNRPCAFGATTMNDALARLAAAAAQSAELSVITKATVLLGVALIATSLLRFARAAVTHAVLA